MADEQTPKPGSAGPREPPVVVKKYANRRLYDTESSAYITLESLAAMVRKGRDFVVYDAKTGEDITRGVLTQIIVEEESKGHYLLPTNFLRQLIGIYGGAMQGIVPDYLEQAMKAFTQQQESVNQAVRRTVGQMSSLMPFGNVEEIGRQNMATMERMMAMFNPAARAAGDAPAGTPATEDVAAENAVLRAEIERLRREIDAKGPAKA